MADNNILQLERKLRNRLGRFLGNSSPLCRHPVYEMIQRIKKLDRPAYLCGGALRDVLMSEGRIVPRDFDIIVAYASQDDIYSLFSDHTNLRKTRLGGWCVQAGDYSIDIWPLSETWAFKTNGIQGKGFSDFTRSTFLDIDAVAADLSCKQGRPRTLYSHGFFRAILSRTIEINFKENPYPAGCIVKALRIAIRYDMALGPKLVQYIADQMQNITVDEVLDGYVARYGGAGFIKEYLRLVQKHAETENSQPLRLQDRVIQTQLWSSPEKLAHVS